MITNVKDFNTILMDQVIGLTAWTLRNINVHISSHFILFVFSDYRVMYALHYRGSLEAPLKYTRINMYDVLPLYVYIYI